MNSIGVADLGSQSTKVLLGKPAGGAVSLTGIGRSKTEGVRGGKIVHPSRAGESLSEATTRASEMASTDVSRIYIGAGGDAIDFSTRNATISITSEDGVVTKEDITRLKDLVSANGPGAGKTIIAVVPRNFFLDGQKGSTNPAGLEARRLDLSATLVTIDEATRKTLKKTAGQADLKLAGVLPSPLCLGRLLLTKDARTRGRIIVDIGRDTVDLSIIKDDTIKFHKTRQLGGSDLTGDLAAKLNISRDEARKIKHGIDLSEYNADTAPSQSVGVEKQGAHSKQEGITALTARLEEIFELLLSDISDQGFGELISYGIHITGGSGKMAGLTDYLNKNFEARFRLARPDSKVRGIKDVIANPIYSNVLGLLTSAAEERVKGRRVYSQGKQEDSSSLTNFIEKVRRFFRS